MFVDHEDLLHSSDSSSVLTHGAKSISHQSNEHIHDGNCQNEGREHVENMKECFVLVEFSIGISVRISYRYVVEFENSSQESIIGTAWVKHGWCKIQFRVQDVGVHPWEIHDKDGISEHADNHSIDEEEVNDVNNSLHDQQVVVGEHSKDGQVLQQFVPHE